MMPKPEILPLVIAKLKGSSCWRWRADVFGWYVKLLVEMADSDRTGYLPNDPVRLCELVNEWDEDLASRPRNWKDIASRFASAWQLHLSGKFVSTDDRLWIYSPRLISSLEPTIGEKVPTTPRYIGVGVGFDLTSTAEIQKLFEEGYKQYPKHKKPRDAEKAFFQAVPRLARKRAIPNLEAARFIVRKCAEFRDSPSGQKGIYTPYMASWLRADSFEEDPIEWQEGNGNGRQNHSNAEQKRERRLADTRDYLASQGIRPAQDRGNNGMGGAPSLVKKLGQ